MKKLPALQALVDHADELLGTASTPDYPNALNGLQFENTGPVKGIAVAVDFSIRSIEGTLAAAANLLVVHHGMFWSGLEPHTGRAYAKLRMLLENDIAVYASHLPLDRHPSLGNNTLLARALGLKPSAGFARFREIDIGVQGTTDVETTELADRVRKFSASHGTHAVIGGSTDRRQTRRWAICTGSGASVETLKEAESAGIDTLIVGEGPHWTAVQSEEKGLTVMYAGHYATETLGVRALGEHLSKKFAIPSTFIDAPTGL